MSWKSIKPSRSSGGHLQSEMRTRYALQHVFMQDCGTWPPPGVHCSTQEPFFRWQGSFSVKLGMCRPRPGGERGQERRGDCCKNHSIWRVDPTFVCPNHFLQFSCLGNQNNSWSMNLRSVYELRSRKEPSWRHTIIAPSFLGAEPVISFCRLLCMRR